MKIAVMKRPDPMYGVGFNYHTFPKAMEHDFETECFRLMGYTIVEVEDEVGEHILCEARISIKHQCQIAVLVAQAEKES